MPTLAVSTPRLAPRSLASNQSLAGRPKNSSVSIAGRAIASPRPKTIQTVRTTPVWWSPRKRTIGTDSLPIRRCPQGKTRSMRGIAAKPSTRKRPNATTLASVGASVGASMPRFYWSDRHSTAPNRVWPRKL